jgi:hypothetical protein
MYYETRLSFGWLASVSGHSAIVSSHVADAHTIYIVRKCMKRGIKHGPYQRNHTFLCDKGRRGLEVATQCYG